jgi:superfamily II DNA/RNA helicase
LDLPDIEIVVQYKATCTLCALWQRFGRAARGVGNKGTAILLVEKKYFRKPGGVDTGGSIKNSGQKKRKERTDDIDQPPPAKRPALSNKVINVQPTPPKPENIETACVEDNIDKRLDPDDMAEPSMRIDDLIADLSPSLRPTRGHWK